MREWRDITGCEDRYEVSNDGLVRTKPRVLKPGKTPKGGHLYVSLGERKREYVHRLVAQAFLPNERAAPVVNHKNGDPADNRVQNLEWVTYGENIAHGYRVLNRDHYSRVRVAALDSTGVQVAIYRSITDAADAIGVTRGALARAVRIGGTCRKLRWVRA